MPRLAYRWALSSMAVVCLFLAFSIASGTKFSGSASILLLQAEPWREASKLFFGIFLEALPFILLGVLVSSVLHLFVPENALRRILPSHPVPGVLTACLLGIVLPVCECGMIPIVRGLIRKGMPAYIGIPYILAAPIINPVTYAGTRLAFPNQPAMAVYRMGLAFGVAAVVGWTLYWFAKRDPLRSEESGASRSHHHHHEPHGASDGRLLQTLSHASDEFFEMGKYLLLGAFLTAVIQTFAGRQALTSLDAGPIVSHMLMMGFAYLISLCSTSDAFVAASFSGTFHPGALLSFLVFGPMIDFKNTLMMLAVFRRRFVAKLSLLIAAVVLGGSLWMEYVLL